jgi:integrase
MAEIMLFARITSVRQGDIIRIKTEDIIEEGINYFIHKTQEDAFIPFTENLKACVSRLLHMRHNPQALYPTLICTLDGKPYSDYGFKSKWRRINDKALQIGYISERVKFRNIRSMAANLAFEQGGIKRAQELLGHNDAKTTTKHYLLKQKKIIVPLE